MFAAAFRRDRGVVPCARLFPRLRSSSNDSAPPNPCAAAGREHDVASPLALVGLTKANIRECSRARGIPTWQQPSSPCLSSRLPYGTAVTIERLRQVEVAEEELRRIGVAGDLRVRHHGDLARVELDQRELARWLSALGAEQVRAAVVSAGFDRVEIDPRGYRSGSLNVLAGVSAAVPDPRSDAVTRE